jgi:hypothetical protein
MPKSFPLLTAAAAALIAVVTAATPAQAAPALSWASPLLAPAALSVSVPLAGTEPAPKKNDLTRVLLAASAGWRAAEDQTDALIDAVAFGSAPAFVATPLAAPEALGLDEAQFASLEAAPAEAPVPLVPALDASRETANRPDEIVLADARDGLEVVSLDELGNYAGGTGLTLGVLTNPVLTGLASGNTVSGVDVTSGGITIETDAFSGYDGIGNFVINSGHNNVLQSTVNVSIVMTPP